MGFAALPDGLGERMDKTEIRNAATLILVRDPETDPKVLMGQRGANAAFMPNKFVFPGGAVDREDGNIPLARALPEICGSRLDQDATGCSAKALYAAAIRELWEETGLALGADGVWDSAPDGWADFAARGVVPDPSQLHFVFRAITPPGRPRRFDARFFLANASAIAGDPDDFGDASDELSHLQWIPLPDVRRFTLPFITEVVLAEISASLPGLGPPASVPFFDNREEESVFRRIA